MKFIRRRNGSAAIEFAISLPMYLILFFGVLFFGQSSFIDQEMNLARAFATFSSGMSPMVISMRTSSAAISAS